MKYYILALSIAFLINFIMYIITSKIYKKHEDLGCFKTNYTLYSVKYFGSLKTTYFMEISFQGKIIRQVISEYDFHRLQGYNEEHVYIRKFSRKILSPNFAEYEFKLEEKSWQELDKEKLFKGFVFSLLIFWLYITIIYFDSQNF